ncbi:hypothetical protein PFISCL1PPCAC_9628, partial [Pristionchus fissidentatus]
FAFLNLEIESTSDTSISIAGNHSSYRCERRKKSDRLYRGSGRFSRFLAKSGLRKKEQQCRTRITSSEFS